MFGAAPQKRVVAGGRAVRQVCVPQ